MIKTTEVKDGTTWKYRFGHLCSGGWYGKNTDCDLCEQLKRSLHSEKKMFQFYKRELRESQKELKVAREKAYQRMLRWKKTVKRYEVSLPIMEKEIKEYVKKMKNDATHRT